MAQKMGQSTFSASIKTVSMFKTYLLTLKCVTILLLDQKVGGIQLYQLSGQDKYF